MNATSAVQPNSIGSRLVASSKVPVAKLTVKRLNRKLKAVKRKIQHSPFAGQVTGEEINQIFSSLNTGKASGVDGLLPSFFMNLGDKANKWLKQVLRPVSLLCIGYKILERIIFNRISSAVHSRIPKAQAGFIPNRSCCEQVLSLMTHIEAGFQHKLKPAVVFIDLSVAFDTIWENAAVLKLAQTIKCKKPIGLAISMLSNRMLRAFLGGKWSSSRNSGLPQGGQSNKFPNRKIDLLFSGKAAPSKYSYLGITLDRLTFCLNLRNIRGKLMTRLNIILKLLGSSCSAPTLRISSLAFL